MNAKSSKALGFITALIEEMHFKWLSLVKVCLLGPLKCRTTQSACTSNQIKFSFQKKLEMPIRHSLFISATTKAKAARCESLEDGSVAFFFSLICKLHKQLVLGLFPASGDVCPWDLLQYV